MNTHRITVGFIMVFTVACCLALGGRASPAAAKTIVVTTNQDVVDPPLNADGVCGTGTIADLRGADGQVSLREAVIADNNTPGVKSITFAPSLSGTTIVLTRSLALCGGHTTLNGDVNGDDTPDVTVDGTAVLFPFDVIDLLSSHKTAVAATKEKLVQHKYPTMLREVKNMGHEYIDGKNGVPTLEEMVRWIDSLDRM